MPPQKLLDQSKRAKNFISSKGKWKNNFAKWKNNWIISPPGYPRYCTATTLPDGTTVLNGGRSRRGKPRGPPGSRELQTALKGCDDPLFLDFIRRCLEWDPAARMTPNAALRHAWLRRRLPRPPQVPHLLPPPHQPSSVYLQIVKIKILKSWWSCPLQWDTKLSLSINEPHKGAKTMGWKCDQAQWPL